MQHMRGKIFLYTLYHIVPMTMAVGPAVLTKSFILARVAQLRHVRTHLQQNNLAIFFA